MQSDDKQATEQELAARYADLFLICYQRRDISGMHITFTAFTHVLHCLKMWDRRKNIMQQTEHYILLNGFPEAELPALQWLLRHYFEQGKDGSEDELLAWYQMLDDEWVLRKKLKDMFPQYSNTQLTILIAEELKKNPV